MTKKQLLVSVALLAMVWPLAVVTPGLAQKPQTTPQRPHIAAQKAPTAAPTAAPPGGTTPTAGNDQQSGPGPSDSSGTGGEPESGHRSPVFMVTSVEVLRAAHAPAVDVVRVTGVVASSGWDDPELVPFGVVQPGDGMLNLVLVAEGPSEAKEADGFATVEAMLPIDPAQSFKGVRVRSATNALVLHEFSGVAEAPVSAEDCAKCIGKMFVPTGQPVPAGAGNDDVVKQESLPPATLIIKPTDGISDTSPNPNRLTLILGDDNRIVDVFWN